MISDGFFSNIKQQKKKKKNSLMLKHHYAKYNNLPSFMQVQSNLKVLSPLASFTSLSSLSSSLLYNHQTTAISTTTHLNTRNYHNTNNNTKCFSLLANITENPTYQNTQWSSNHPYHSKYKSKIKHHKSSYSLQKQSSIPLSINTHNTYRNSKLISNHTTLLQSLSFENNIRNPKEYTSIWPLFQQEQLKTSALAHGRCDPNNTKRHIVAASKNKSVSGNSNTNTKHKLKIISACSYQMKTNNNDCSLLYSSFDLTRKFLKVNIGLPMHFKAIVKLKSIKFLMTNYIKFIIRIIQSSSDFYSDNTNEKYIMTKKQFSHYYHLYKEPHYTSFINDFFLIFNHLNWSIDCTTNHSQSIDMRIALTIILFLGNISSYSTALCTVLQMWFHQSQIMNIPISIVAVLNVFLLIQSNKGNYKRMIEVIKGTMETELLYDELKLRLERNAELKMIINSIVLNIEQSDEEFIEEVKKMSHRKMVNYQYVIKRNAAQMHCCNEIKAVEGILEACRKIRNIHDEMNPEKKKKNNDADDQGNSNDENN